VQWA